MTGVQHVDNLVLGSGEAGQYLAWTLAKAGQRSAVVERGALPIRLALKGEVREFAGGSTLVFQLGKAEK